MPVTLVLLVTTVSLLAFLATWHWFPGEAVHCAVQVVALLGLVALAASAPEDVLRACAIAAAAVFIALFGRRRQLTVLAMIVALVGVVWVILKYPPSWFVAVTFVLGWANFVGSLSHSAWEDDYAPGKMRDFTDLIPLCLVIFGGGALEPGSEANALLLFGALSFLANDVLASDVGPFVRGRAFLLPGVRPVPHGTPGAVSLGGTVFGLFGSAVVGACAGILTANPVLAFAVAAAGTVGAICDSLLCRSGLRSRISRGSEAVNGLSMATAVACAFVIPH
jgi:uncharacterized membrane protein